MKKSIITTVAILASQMGFSQISFDGNKFLKDGQTYKLKQYEQVFSNEEAKDYFKKARANKTAGDIISSVGGFGIGFGLGGALLTPKYSPYGFKNDKSTYWTIFGVGTGITAISIPFYLGFAKNSSKAITIENNSESMGFKPYFKVESNGSNIALSYHF